MSREAHVRFCEGPEVQFPRPTHHQLHWVLDVGFREDDCRVRVGNAAQNFAVIRRVALNLLKTVQGGLKKNGKLGVYNKRLLAGWDDSYLLRILGVHS